MYISPKTFSTFSFGSMPSTFKKQCACRGTNKKVALVFSVLVSALMLNLCSLDDRQTTCNILCTCFTSECVWLQKTLLLNNLGLSPIPSVSEQEKISVESAMLKCCFSYCTKKWSWGNGSKWHWIWTKH